MSNAKLSALRARELFSYDPETGELRWRVSTAKKIKPGAIAGCKAEDGYVLVGADKVLYKAHRVVWLLEHGVWPTDHIDHIDGNPANNRIANLRDVSPTVNQQNHRQATAASSTGLLGAFPKREKFTSAIRVNKTLKRLGTFTTAEEAHQAYLVAKRQMHAGCTI